MPAFATVEKGDNHARIEQNRFQRPNPLRCFLLEPRSRTRDENLASPTTRGRPGSGWDDASLRPHHFRGTPAEALHELLEIAAAGRIQSGLNGRPHFS